MFALCEQMKIAGIAPLAFQGRYPGYAQSLLKNVLVWAAGGRPE